MTAKRFLAFVFGASLVASSALTNCSTWPTWDCGVSFTYFAYLAGSRSRQYSFDRSRPSAQRLR